jgi:hypothetical protein
MKDFISQIHVSVQSFSAPYTNLPEDQHLGYVAFLKEFFRLWLGFPPYLGTILHHTNGRNQFEPPLCIGMTGIDPRF